MKKKKTKEFIRIPFVYKKKHYILSADKYQYILYRKTDKGETPIGHYSRLNHLFNSLFEKEIRESGAKTFEELKKAFGDGVKELENILAIFETEKFIEKVMKERGWV